MHLNFFIPIISLLPCIPPETSSSEDLDKLFRNEKCSRGKGLKSQTESSLLG